MEYAERKGHTDHLVKVISSLYARIVATGNVGTPGNVAKKTLPENVANVVGGYIFGEHHTQKCSSA